MLTDKTQKQGPRCKKVSFPLAQADVYSGSGSEWPIR